MNLRGGREYFLRQGTNYETAKTLRIYQIFIGQVNFSQIQNYHGGYLKSIVGLLSKSALQAKGCIPNKITATSYAKHVVLMKGGCHHSTSRLGQH